MFERMLSALTEEHLPKTTIEHQLAERLAILFWRGIRLAKAEAFDTRANRSNLEFEDEMEEKAAGSFVRNRLPR